MGIFDRFKKKPEPKVAPSPKKKTAKEIATEKGEPWVTVVSMDIDLDNPGSGAFELDFNDIFVAKLVRAGYKGKTDYDIVDQWFTTVCRNVVMENHEQWEADPEHRER